MPFKLTPKRPPEDNVEEAIIQAAEACIKQLEPYLDELPEQFVIAGGAIANGVCNLLLGTNAPIRDIDVFIPKTAVRKGGKPAEYSGKDFHEISSNGKLNLIEANLSHNSDDTDSCSTLLSRFDLNCCQAGVHINRKTGEAQPITSKDFDYYLRSKIISMNPLYYNGGTARKIARYFDKLECFSQLDNSPSMRKNIAATLDFLRIAAFLSEKPAAVKLVPKTWEKFQKALPHLEPFFDVKLQAKQHTVQLTPKPSPVTERLKDLAGKLAPGDAGAAAAALKGIIRPALDKELANLETTIQDILGDQPTAATREDTKKEQVGFIRQIPKFLPVASREGVVQQMVEKQNIPIHTLIEAYLYAPTSGVQPFIEEYLKDPTKPLPQKTDLPLAHPNDEWTILHAAAFHGALHRLPEELLTKELLLQKSRINREIKPISPIGVLQEYEPLAFSELPERLKEDPEVITNHTIVSAILEHRGTREDNLITAMNKIPRSRLTGNIIEKLERAFHHLIEIGVLHRLEPKVYADHYQFFKKLLDQRPVLVDAHQKWLQELAKEYIKSCTRNKGKIISGAPKLARMSNDMPLA